MSQVFRAIALSISQFSDPQFQRVVLKSILLAVVALWALAAGGGAFLGWLFSGSITIPWIGTITFSGSMVGWSAFCINAFLDSRAWHSTKVESERGKDPFSALCSPI